MEHPQEQSGQPELASTTCKREGCTNPPAKGQVYCCRGCSPYGYYGIGERGPTNYAPPKAEDLTPKPEPVKKRRRRRPKKKPDPGNGKIAFKFTDNFIRLLSDPSYLKSWNDDILQKVRGRMMLISYSLDDEIKSRQKDKGHNNEG